MSLWRGQPWLACVNDELTKQILCNLCTNHHISPATLQDAPCCRELYITDIKIIIELIHILFYQKLIGIHKSNQQKKLSDETGILTALMGDCN